MGLEYDLFISNLFSKADKSSVPLSGSFELTSRCPLDCKMCYIHRKENDCEAMKHEKSTQWWLDLARQAQEAGMLMLLLTGGEPLLRKDFEEIYLGAKKLGLLVSVNTNGLLIDDDKVKFFADNPPQKLNISLYGASEETYRELCGNGKAYEKVFTAVRKLREAGIGVKINYTATQYNSHDAKKIYDFANELGLPVQTVTYMFPPVRAGGDTAERMSPEEAAKVQFECKLLNMGGERLRKHIEAKADIKRKNTDGGERGEQIPCRAGKSTFWVTWDGKMTPCGMMTTPMFEISSFNDAWECIKKSRENIFLPLKCKTCDLRNYCDMCAAVTLAETNDFSTVPEYLCRKAAEHKRLCEEFMTKHENHCPRNNLDLT
ncbi:MAG: radical SAM protein [Ruminococcaceae bacterium]|nr:radical SAM protein [Oscillospiraceae bacterium]